MKLLALALFCVTIALMTTHGNAIFLGTCEGYIKNSTGGFVQNAQVNATVSSCSESCKGSALSDVNGYYVIGNLNLPAGGTVTVNAFHAPTSGSGSNSGIADAFQAASVNITLCRSPSAPTLTPEPDTHGTSATLVWVSGTDPDNLSKYDRYQLDSNSIINNATSPQSESSLSYASHTWRVQTCNAACCSNWVSDTFLVYNNAPTQPNLTDQPNTINNTVILQWISGTDADNDTTYDHYQFDSNPVANATSPRTEANLSFGAHSWRVRTCDALGTCSAWAIDTFSIVNNPCPAPVLTAEPDTHYDNASLVWTSNATDIDGDPCHDRFQFASQAIIDPAASPQTVTNLTWGSTYTWRVQSCDNKGACSSWQSDSFSVTNNPPSAPNLTDQNHTSSSSVALSWVSGTDPENDTTYDQYRFNYGNITNATSPQVEASLGSIAYYVWEVRTCDSSGACSAWASDSFIKYECPACQGGGGGGEGGVWSACTIFMDCKNETLTCNATPSNGRRCNETWVCEDWGTCLPGGVQVRECAETHGCGTKCFAPEMWRRCTPSVEIAFPKPAVELPYYMLVLIMLAIIVVAFFRRYFSYLR